MWATTSTGGPKPIFSRLVNFVYPEPESPFFKTYQNQTSVNLSTPTGWAIKKESTSPKVYFGFPHSNKNLTPLTKARVEKTNPIRQSPDNFNQQCSMSSHLGHELTSSLENNSLEGGSLEIPYKHTLNGSKIAKKSMVVLG